MIQCVVCDKEFWPKDVAPLVRFAHGGSGCGCYRCVARLIKEGFLFPHWPFWMRQEGRDRDE